MVAGGSVLASTSGPGAAQWATAITLGAAGTGRISINGRLQIINTQLDDANQSINATVIMPAVTTTTRSAFNFDVTTAGSSANAQQGLVFTMEAGYTGSATIRALLTQSGVATTG